MHTLRHLTSQESTNHHATTTRPRRGRRAARSVLSVGHRGTNRHCLGIPGRSSAPRSRSSPNRSPEPPPVLTLPRQTPETAQVGSPGRPARPWGDRVDRVRNGGAAPRLRPSAITRDRLRASLPPRRHRPSPALGPKHTNLTNQDRSPAAPLGGPDRTCQAVDLHHSARLSFTYQHALI